MRDRTAFIGDVHGNLPALRSLVDELDARDVARVVLLGDFINKGADSAGVIDYVLGHEVGPRLLAIRGNHEEALLRCLETGDLAELLAMGGAPTVRSYVGGDAPPDVFRALDECVPGSHRAFLRSLPGAYRASGVVASHRPISALGQYVVSGHRFVGKRPLIGAMSAQIDTGCGTAGGRLTALLWPSRAYLQAGEDGRLIDADAMAQRDGSGG